MTRSKLNVMGAKVALIVLLGFTQASHAQDPATPAIGSHSATPAAKGGVVAPTPVERPEAGEKVNAKSYRKLISEVKKAEPVKVISVRPDVVAGKTVEVTVDVKGEDKTKLVKWLSTLSKFRATLEKCDNDSFESKLAKWIDTNLYAPLKEALTGNGKIEQTVFNDRVAMLEKILKSEEKAFSKEKEALAKTRKELIGQLKATAKQFFTTDKASEKFEEATSADIVDGKSVIKAIKDAKEDGDSLCVGSAAPAPVENDKDGDGVEDDATTTTDKGKDKTNLGDQHPPLPTNAQPQTGGNQPETKTDKKDGATDDKVTKKTDQEQPFGATNGPENFGGANALDNLNNDDLLNALADLQDQANQDQILRDQQFRDALAQAQNLAALAAQAAQQDNGNNRDVQVRSAEQAPQQQQPFIPPQLPLPQTSNDSAPVAQQQPLPQPEDQFPEQFPPQQPFMPPLPQLPAPQQPAQDTAPRFAETPAAPSTSNSDLISLVKGLFGNGGTDMGRQEENNLGAAIAAAQQGGMYRPNAFVGSRAQSLANAPVRATGGVGMAGQTRGLPQSGAGSTLGRGGPVGAVGPLPSALQSRGIR